MIDRLAHRHLAGGIRHLVAGHITNDEFEDKWFAPTVRSKDPAVREIFAGVWMLYSDLTC